LELQRKLSAKGFTEIAIDVELARLAAENLQDDNRFAQSYIRYRARRGYGPVKIRIELNQRGIDEVCSAPLIEQSEIDWRERIQTAWQKKFGRAASSFEERAKQARFLRYRGFTGDQISVLLGSVDVS
jgi:regulatory protein